MSSISSQKASSSSSFSSSTPQREYDVFLSFRGKDTRTSFAKHLYDALKRRDIVTFRDSENLGKGKSISLELLKSINESKFAIVVFSRNYALSTWCLDELTKIIGCPKEMTSTVLPILYDVDLFDVRKQISTFAQAFSKHEERFKDDIEKVQTWRVALEKVANLKGWHLLNRSKQPSIRDIVCEFEREFDYGQMGCGTKYLRLPGDLKVGQMKNGMENRMVKHDLDFELISRMVGPNLAVDLKNRILGPNLGVDLKYLIVGRGLEVRGLQKRLTGIEDLPISQLLEILYRLDLKSAMRCKSVARQWCYLISDPSFANGFVRLHASSVVDRPFALLLHYVDKQIKKRHLLVTSEEPEFQFLTYIPPIYQHDNIEVTVQASFNDLLLCCANMVGNDAGSGPMSEYYVINPISRQWTALPPMPQLARARVGFICWYDTALHEQLSYRVMRIPEFKGEAAEFGVEIFSSDTGKWTQSVGLCPQGFQLDVFAFPGVPYKGLLFWWSSTDCLLGFDPNTSKCCQFFEKPIELNPSHGIERLGVCHGTLRICQISGYPYEVADPCLRVWELKDYDEGGKWNLEHELYFDKMVSEKSPWLTEYLSKKYPTVAVLAYHPNDREIVYLMIKFKVVSCNLRRKTLEVVCDIPTADYFYHGCNVFTFVLPCWLTPIPFQTEKAT